MPLFAIEFTFIAVLGVALAYGLLMSIDPGRWFELIDRLCRSDIYSKSYRANRLARLQWRTTGVILNCICIYLFIWALRGIEPTAQPVLISTILLRLGWLMASIALVLWPNWWLRGHGRWRPAYSAHVLAARWPPIVLRVVGVASALAVIMISTVPR